MKDNQESKDFLFKIILILLGITIISGVIVWIIDRSNTSVTSGNNQQQQANCPGIDGTNRISQQKDKRSVGEEVLVNLENNNAKVAGIEAFKNCNFEEAIAKFEAWRETNGNDPEALIYLNNAIVAQNKQPTLKIVASVPLGRNLGIAEEILRGVAQAQKEVNKGDGINGKYLLVEIANDNNDDALVSDLAQEFIEDETIRAVVGHNSSKTSRAAAAKYEQGKLVMVSPTSGQNDLAEQYPNYVFRTVPPAILHAESLANRIYYDESSGDLLEKIAICYDSQDPYSDSFQEDFKNRILKLNSDNPNQPQAIISDTDCDLSGEQFDPQEAIDKIKGQGADALLLVASVNTIDEAAKIVKAQGEAQGEDRLALFGSNSMYTGKIFEIGEEGLEGMILAVPWHRDAVEDNNSFPDNAFELWGGPVNWSTALAYDATKVIIEGLKKSETREGLQKALKEPNFSFDGATGTVTFDDDGDRQEQLQVLVIIKADYNKPNPYSFELLNSN